MKTIQQMFQEGDEGSMTRMLSFMLVCAGIFAGLYPLMADGELHSDTITLCFGLIGAGLTGKLVQKGIEVTFRQLEVVPKDK